MACERECFSALGRFHARKTGVLLRLLGLFSFVLPVLIVLCTGSLVDPDSEVSELQREKRVGLMRVI